jgi:hypothetical protein
VFFGFSLSWQRLERRVTTILVLPENKGAENGYGIF